MREVLKTAASLSLSGSLAILVLLVLRPLLRERFRKRWQYYIWLIVIVRLLLPLGPETNLMGKTYQTIDQAITHSVSLPQQPFRPWVPGCRGWPRAPGKARSLRNQPARSNRNLLPPQSRSLPPCRTWRRFWP